MFIREKLKEGSKRKRPERLNPQEGIEPLFPKVRAKIDLLRARFQSLNPVEPPISPGSEISLQAKKRSKLRSNISLQT